METTKETLDLCRGWVETDVPACTNDLRRLGLDGAAAFNHELAIGDESGIWKDVRLADMREALLECLSGTDPEIWAARASEIREQIANRSGLTFRSQKSWAFKVAAKLGMTGCSPFGNRDKKTMTIGTYRRVGDTCPSTCPFLGNGCYAEKGNVNTHQRRASADSDADLWAVAIAAAIADLRGEPLRFHVSGDFISDDDWDLPYIMGVAGILSKFPNVQAWTYTHAAEVGLSVESLRSMLPSVKIWDSTSTEDYGSALVVSSFEDHVRRRGDIRCPAQLSDGVSCLSCGACWDRDRTDLGKTRIIFEDVRRAKRKVSNDGKRQESKEES